MLITRRGNDLYLVKQVDHGEVAGQFARAWGNDLFEPPAPFESACTAAAKHDEGWRPWDDRPAFNEQESRPLHFLEILMEDHIPLYHAGVEAVARMDAYAGVLVGMHWTGLYRGRWGLQSNVSDLLQADRSPVQKLQDAAVLAEEARWIPVKTGLWCGAESRAAFETRLWHDYELLQGWDLLSLFVCTAPLAAPSPASEPALLSATLKSLDQPPGKRLIPGVATRMGEEPVALVLTVIEPGVVAVEPYPFSSPTAVFSVEAAVIPDRRYTSDEIAGVFEQARTATIRCEMRPAVPAAVERRAVARPT